MKVLLDENLPHKLRAHLVQHETATVAYLGWGGLKNGELLQAAEDAGFEVFVTGDRALAHQQNLGARKLAIVSLSANNWPIIKNHVARIASAVDGARPGSFVRVECGAFTRKGPRPTGLS
jgi:hypothetical protein